MNTYPTIDELLEQHVAFMGEDWEDDDEISISALPGLRHKGQIACINCNDLFMWASADGEPITEETMPLFRKAYDDCNQDANIAGQLYCSRIKQMRPQGACYSSIPKNLWHLFDACGPERETGFGNPCKPGEYGKKKSLFKRILNIFTG